MPGWVRRGPLGHDAAVPEGHTIHRLARDQRRDLAGGPVRATSPQGRFEQGAARIDGAVLASTEAWGKHLFHTYATGDVLHVHLGLIGRFRRLPSPPPAPVGVVRLRLQGEARTWDLSGPMTCRLVTPGEQDALVAGLGPDPLRRDADPSRFVERVRASRTSIGALLLDQSVIAGIGNVYRAEVLWALGIHPARPGRSLSEDEAMAVWTWLRHQLRAGVRRNRIVTVDPAELGRPLAQVTKAEAVAVYHHEACRRCGSTIARLEVAGRRIDACPTCQT
jgi:endonuclease VIII